MAGTLTIGTLSDGTNSTSATNCIQGSAKAWVKATGASPGSVVSSFNVSSITYNSTGNYTISFTNALASANWAFAAGAQANSTSPNDTLSCCIVNGTQAAGSVRVTTGIGGSGVRDAGNLYFAAFI
jgi:hypothetical protein